MSVPRLRALLAALLLPLRLAAADDAPKADAPRFALQAVLSDLEPTRERDQRRAELYWVGVTASWVRGDWGAEAEVRGRDGRFRPYYDGDVWLERAAAWVKTPAGVVRVGKVASIGGLPDTTFGGDLLSLNGVTRNPEWGASLTGTKSLGWDTLGWSLRWAGQNDHVAWEEDGRDVESDAGATLRDGLSGRVEYLWNKGLVTLKPGVSAATARIVGEDGVNRLRRTDVQGDVRATLGPLSVEGLTLWRHGDAGAAWAAGTPGSPRLGYDEGWAWLFAFGAEFPTVTYRYTYSEWRYLGTGGNERVHQPSVVWTPVKGVEAVVEFAARRLRLGGEARAFGAFRLGLTLSY